MSSERYVKVMATLIALAAIVGCSRQAELEGGPDAFVFFEPMTDAEGRQVLDASGLPVLRHLPATDKRVAALVAVLQRGIPAHALELEQGAKREVRQSIGSASGYTTAARAEANEPTVFVFAGEPEDAVLFRVGVGFAVESWSGRPTHGAAFVEVGSEPDEDTALAQTVSGRLGMLAAMRIASPGGLAARRPGPHAFVGEGEQGALVEGFGMALEALARDEMAAGGHGEAGTAEQQQRAASIRDNAFVFADGRARGVRHAEDLLADPGMTGALLYRLARSPASDRPDPVLFAKWLRAWSFGVCEGASPRDAADLVDAYARLFPEEREGVVRAFVSSTFGATVQAGGIDPTRSLAVTKPNLDALADRVIARELALKAAVALP
jgi:hypothetical protein